MANGDFLDISTFLMGSIKKSDIGSNLIDVKFGWVKQGLYRHSSIGSINMRTELHPGVPPPTTESTREAVYRSSGKKPGTRLPKYTQNIMIQHQGEDQRVNPTPLSAALTLQQCLFGDSKKGTIAD
ncbi:hypothetical protein TNCV_1942371 [Trichonephila clavipes]|uniref:Uncharacterized protein n=1 Tax=Trichonephila clavipes TaxID=2585209 RepID=A0A8X6V906_TRICX|nr:hypothetical protein TNCV_1942371 [Trichonephila clavipes]